MYRMLIADDEPFIVEGLKYIMNWEEFGIELIGTASNGFEALELIKKGGADLLITDIKMPKMSGLELIQKVKELKLNTRFIILSGYDDFEYLKESIKLGIENYLLKPINCEELEETIVNARNKLESQNLQNSYSNKDMDIIKNNILYRWVTASISESELLERASLLDIPLEYSKYVACILRLFPNTDAGDDLYVLIQKAEEICANAIKSCNSGVIFCTPENNIVFIMNDLEESHNLARHCISNLKDDLNVNCFITIGSIENDYKIVSRSYFRALELQQHSIIMPANSILDYLSFMKRSTEKNESISPLIKRVLEYVKNNHSSDLSLKTLAIDFNANSNYLGQLFKEETGEYFSDYLNMVRINKAKELLQSTGKSTKDISVDVGYKDVNYFYKTFKKYCGVSPSEFRSM
ncbi:response regulator transcription factor [Acetivibrio cellulolyticus]|uniref:response regulator transcription factor n=1 Tax=Acetivibrio cellulolyticus TaxID=35830 RepID=UPI0001E2E73A|nr:response regulator transcription factor [Acetivibrio cellulolyticus]